MEKRISRRNFLRVGALALGIVAVSKVTGVGSVFAAQQEKSRVFFTKDISDAGLLNIYPR